MHIAAQADELECVQLLLKHGLNPTVKDNEGRTALEWATELGHLKIARVLTENAAAQYDESLRERYPELASEEGKGALGEWCDMLLVIVLGLALYWFGFKRLLAEESPSGHSEL